MTEAHTDRPLATLGGPVSRQWWIAVGAVVLVLASTAFFTVRQEPRYEASADVLLSRQNLAASLAGIDDRGSVSSDVERFTETQADVAGTPKVARRVVLVVGAPEGGAAALLRDSEVLTKKSSDVLQIRVRHGEPDVARRLATEYARQFTRYRRELDTAALSRASREVGRRIETLQAWGESRSPLYRTLIEKQEQLSTLEALQTSNAFVIRSADAARQVQPRPVRNALLGLLLGAVLGLGLAWARDSLDTRVRSVGEIENGLGMPLLARIPPFGHGVKRGQVAMLEAPMSPQAEAFRKLRTGIEFAQLDRHTREILVTSAIGGEGKSTTVANLAVALALGGRRVVVVDLDLRRPTVAGLLGVRSEPGLTDVVLGRAGLDEALVEVRPPSAPSFNGSAAAGSLRVLPTGPLPPNPGEFVGSQALSRVRDAVTERADLVLLDTPPLLEVGDATTLSARDSGLLLVTRLKLVRRTMLPELRRLIHAAPSLELGFVATGVDGPQARYAYGYGYGYGAAPPGLGAADVREAVR